MFKKGAIMAKADCNKCRGVGSYFGAGCLRFQCECEKTKMNDYDIEPDKAKNYEQAFKVRAMSGVLPKRKSKSPYDIRGSSKILTPHSVEQMLDENLIQG